MVAFSFEFFENRGSRSNKFRGKKELLSGFQTNFDIDAVPFVCGSCGRMEIATSTVHKVANLEVLKATGDFMTSIDHEYRPAYNVCNVDAEWFHLNPDCVREDNTVELCKLCEQATKTVPWPVAHICYKNGFDLGSFKRIGLPALSLVESQMISKVRHFSTIAKFKGFLPDFQAISGHYISFPHDGPKVATSLPRQDVLQSFAVVFVGSKKQYADRRKFIAEQLQVRLPVMLAWLRFLKVVHPSYHDVVIDDSVQCEHITDALISYAHIADSRLAASLENFAAAPGAEMVNANGMEHILVTPQIADVESFDALKAILESVRLAVPQRSHGNAPTTIRVDVPRADRPVNEFKQNKMLMGCGFPHLFATFNFALVAKEGGLPQKVLRYFFDYYDGRFAREPQFAFLVFNQMQRHSLCFQVAKSIRSDKDAALSNIAAMIDDPTLSDQLDEAMANPNSPGSIVLQKRILRYVQMYSSKVPFSPMERKGCLQKIYSMFYYGGYPSVYWTLSPSDMDQPHTIRLALRSVSNPKADILNIPISKDFHARMDILRANPCYAAMTFNRLIEAVLEELIQTDNGSRRVLKDVLRKRGIFGSCLLDFAVVEAQGRGSLHTHGLAWTNVSCEMLSKLAGTADEEKISKFIDAFVQTELKHLLEGETKDQLRGGLQKCPLPDPKSCMYENFVADAAWTCQQHDKHPDGCFRQTGGVCRYAMPQPLCPKTGAYTVFEKKTSREADGAVTFETTTHARKGIDPPTHNKPSTWMYEEKDERPIAWMTARRDVKDGIVSGYNDVLAGATGSNQCIVPLGGEAQATGIMFYLVKYLTKNSMPLSASLVCLKEAILRQKEDMQRQTSSVDGQTHSTEPQQHPVVTDPVVTENPVVTDPVVTEKMAATRSIMNKLANRILAKIEVSAQMAFAAVLGNPSSYSSKNFSYCQIRDAISFRRAKTAHRTLNKNPTDVSDDAHDDDDDDETSSNEDTQSDAPDAGERATFSFGSDGLVTRSQHLNYAYRGADLRHLSLYEYCAIVNVVDGSGAQNARVNKAPREKNSLIPFHSDHPRFGIDVQQLRSKTCLPIMCGRPCSRVSPTSGRSALHEHCLYMATLFVPWDVEGDIRTSVAQWKCWLQRHRMSSLPHELARFRCAQNVAKGLSGRGKVSDLLNDYRFSCADRQRTDGNKATAGDTGPNVEDDMPIGSVVDELQKQFGENNTFVDEMVSDMDFFYAHASAKVPEVSPQVPKVVEKTGPVRGYVSKPASVILNVNRAHVDDINPTTAGSFEKGHPVNVPPGLQDPKYAQQLSAFQECVQAVLQVAGPELLMLHGGPGTGKSIVSKHIIEQCQRAMPGSIVSTATTGIAAFLLSKDEESIPIKGFPAATYQHTLKLCPGGNNSLNTIAKLQKVTFLNAKAILVDEMSMMGVSGLSAMDEQLRRIKGCQRPFGGLTVILVGDFYQLPPVLATSLLTDIFHLKDFRLLELTDQHRAKDPLHMRMVAFMRDAVRLPQALKWLVQNLKELSPQDIEFVDAPIIVVTNKERCSLNRICALAYAKRHGRPVLAFRLGDFDSDEAMFYFVKGAPAAMNEKIEGTAIVNGMQVTLDSISYHDARVKRQVEAATEKCLPGEVVVVPRPDTINIFFQGELYPVPRASEATIINKKEVVLYFRVDPGFAYTFFKVQGLTLPKIILQLNDRGADKSLGSVGHSC